MLALLRLLRPLRRKYRVLLVFLQLICSGLLISTVLFYFIIGPIDSDLILQKRYHFIVNTIDCSREFNHIQSVLSGLSIQVQNDTSCSGQLLDQKNSGDTYSMFRQLKPAYEYDPGVDNILKYRNKYIESLRQCRMSGKMLCVILEDDAVFINNAAITKLRLVLNTLSLYTNDLDVFDCSKIGFPGAYTGHTGNKSICRIVPNNALLDCIIDVMSNNNYAADTGLSFGSRICGLKQKRFLLVQHGGATSTLGH